MMGTAMQWCFFAQAKIISINILTRKFLLCIILSTRTYFLFLKEVFLYEFAGV